MKLRPHTERIIAGLVLYNCPKQGRRNNARHARFRGTDKVVFQARMCATAYNVKRWVSLQAEKQRGKTPQKRRRSGAPLPVGVTGGPPGVKWPDLSLPKCAWWPLKKGQNEHKTASYA